MSSLSELSLPSGRQHRFSCTNEIQHFESSGSITTKEKEVTGVYGSQVVAAWALAPSSSTKIKSRDKRGVGDSFGVQHQS